MTAWHPRIQLPPDGLLWDIDGTLIDTTSLIVSALDHTYRTFLGKTLPADEIRAIIGTPLSEQVRVFGDPRETGSDPLAMEAEFIRYYEANRHLERVIPEVVDMLITGKKAGITTALVTSKNNEEIANTLPRLGIESYVDLIVSADDVCLPKPDPEGILLALSTLKLDPSSTVFIGDTVHDMRAGRAAGVHCCAVAWGAAPRALLEAEQPEWICSTPRDLATFVGSYRNP